MCVLCNKTKDVFKMRMCFYHKDEMIIYPAEHRKNFTREEIGILNNMLPHVAKRWETEPRYNEHAHVHIKLINKNPYIPPKSVPNIPSNMFECKRLDNLSHYVRRFLTPNMSQKMLEIGVGANIDVQSNEEFWNMEYWCSEVLPLKHERCIVSDISNCKEIADNSFDFVFSMDLFEHLKQPWLAAKEIGRITKPGGIVFTSTLFSWRYHEAPIDYWRFTPQCLVSLFEDDFECIEANWDVAPRRGLDVEGLQGDGKANDKVPEDEFGAWRENWRVYYIGRKKH